MNKQLYWLVALFAWQLLLTVVIYYDAVESILHEFWPGFRTHDIPIGLGDFQIALAMLLLFAVDLRWTLRVPLSLVLFLSAFGAHYIAWVTYFYPMIGGDEYLVALWVAVATACCLGAWQRWRRVYLSGGCVVLPPKPRTAFQFRFSDVLVLIAVIGVSITIVQQAFVLTDVSGMNDPWESNGLYPYRAPLELARGAPITIPSIVAPALAWTAIFALTLRGDIGLWRQLICIPFMLFGLTFAEFAISYCSEVVFDKPPPVVPASHAPLFVLMMHWDFEDIVRIALIFLSRVVACSVSLFCLRMASFQWRPLDAPASEGLADSR